MNYLLIDNSNTRTKLVRSSADALSEELVCIDTDKVIPSVLNQILDGWQFDAVLVCSVVPSKAAILKHYFCQHSFHLLDCRSDHGVEILVDNPEQVGADRIANTIGVTALFPNPAVVVDFGTAVTFDVIDSNGAYLGGAIAPGLGSMNDYLSDKTALLPKIEIEEPRYAIGKTTEQAMFSGAVNGYRGLVRGVLAAIEKELGEKPLVISTGGDGEIISEGVPEIDRFDGQITLEGLRIAAVRIFPTKESENQNRSMAQKNK